jgi:2-C-methyl-D-erythritol 4-phosphate cytidylyltransferase
VSDAPPFGHPVRAGERAAAGAADPAATVRAAVLVPAGGSGTRLGGVAKPFLELAGEPMLVHTLRPFLACREVVAIVVALPEVLAAAPPAWLLALDRRITIVAGGRERGESVRHALHAAPTDVDVVLVHDAARPLATVELVQRTIAAAARGECVIAAVRATDTIQVVDGDRRIVATPDRSRLWQAQTPQGFPRAILADAYRRAAADGHAATDDAALVTRYGGTVRVIEGEPENIKVTYAADLPVAEALLRVRARAASEG